MEFDEEALPVPVLGLLCPSCGFPVDGLPSHRCPECGRDFTMNALIPPGDWPIVAVAGRLVRLTDALALALREARVPVAPGTGPMELLSGYVPSTSAGGCFRVPRSDYFFVLHLLRGQRPAAPSPAPGASSPWVCPACRGVNPWNFDICWACGGGRVPSPG